MENKTKILCIIILMILLIVGFYGFKEFNDCKKHVKVGDKNFTIPKSYSIGTLNKDGDINITNGSNTLFLAEYNEDNIKNYINTYINYLNKTNCSFEYDNFTMDEILIYRVNVNNMRTTHYWFEDDGKIYTIYSWDKTNDTDNIVLNLIKSSDI